MLGNELRGFDEPFDEFMLRASARLLNFLHSSLSPPSMQNPFIGPWRITWMSNWDQDYVDMDVPGHLTFGPAGSGSFQFGMVQGQMDCKPDRRKSERIDFTWHAFDEGDELTGRGHAEIVGGELRGHIYIHLGDESAFRAVKQAQSARRRKTAS